MSASSARRVVTAGSLSLALALAAPAAAFAGPSEDDGRKGGKDTSSSASPGSSSHSSSQRGSSSAGSASSSGSAKESTSSSSSSSSSKAEGKKTPAERSAKSDPRGNNGTVKIDDVPFDDAPGNEPHVGCLFQIDFFGFDTGDVADITLTGQAPTGGGLLWSSPDTPISDDAAGGGQDVDAAITVRFADLDLSGATPHPQQGYHVKLAADVESAPGGAKQKVFWITCAQAPAVAGTTSAPATGAGAGAVTAKAVDRAPLALTFGEGSTTVTSNAVAGTTLTAATGGKGAGAATVSARSANRPSALPFTGAEGLGYLLALGLSAVGVGTAAHRLGRRRATA